MTIRDNLPIFCKDCSLLGIECIGSKPHFTGCINKVRSYANYIAADFSDGQFPLLLGDKFLAKEESGVEHHYQYCGKTGDSEHLIYRDSGNRPYNVKRDWFEQRKISLNPFNEFLI